MPTNLSNLIQQLAEKAGIPSDDKRIIDLLSHTEINKVNIPDDLVNSLQSNLLSLDDAKNNHPKIKSHYFAEIMSNVDRSLTSLYKEWNLSQEDIDELEKETSSTKRILLVGKKFKELQDAEKGKETSTVKEPKEVKELQLQIDRLNEQLRIEKEGRVADKTHHENSVKEFKLKTSLTTRYSALKTVYDHLPADVRNTTIEAILNKELQDNNAHFVIDDNGSLKLLKKDSSNFYNEQNQLVTVDDFINTTLAKSKSLIQNAGNTSEQNNGGTTPQQNGSATQVVTGNSRNTALQSLVKEAQQSLQNQNPVNVIAGT